MGHLIRGELFCFIEEIKKGLAECGMEINVSHGTPFFVEVRDLPRVFAALDTPTPGTWQISSINPAGVEFYFADQDEGDGTLFVPASNIISISTVDDALLAACRQNRTASVETRVIRDGHAGPR